MKPIAMRSLGAFAPPRPKTDAGTIIGAAAAAKPARLRKLLREILRDGFAD
jgi:hypothetical protein